MAEKKEKQYVSDNAQLMAEWDWERNLDIEPTQLSMGSHKKVWWKCSKGHEWQAVIYSRKHNGCPTCSGETRTSFPEQVIFYYLQHLHLRVIQLLYIQMQIVKLLLILALIL